MARACSHCGTPLPEAEPDAIVDDLVRQGKLTDDELREHPQRSIVAVAICPNCGRTTPLAPIRIDPRS